MSTTSYRLVLPVPWERIRLDGSIRARVREIVDQSVARLPKEIPPDQVAPARRRLEGELHDHLLEARSNGGIDYYLPTELMHGQQLNASFVVSAVIPDVTAEAHLVPRVMASLLQAADAEAVTVGDTTWTRRERVLRRRAGGLAGEQVDLRKVEYLTAVPDDPRRWVLVTFTTAGDGDVDSGATGLVVELFDAIMSTWRWVADPPIGTRRFMHDSAGSDSEV
jgi:hypothetical protein